MIAETLEDEPDVSILFLKSILRTAANLIDLLYSKERAIVKVAELMRSLLDTGNNHKIFKLIIKLIVKKEESHVGKMYTQLLTFKTSRGQINREHTNTHDNYL